MRSIASVVIGGLTLAVPIAAAAQTGAPATEQTAAPGSAHTAAPGKVTAAQLRDARFQVSQMERLLEGAVEHGATLIRDRLQAALPVQLIPGQMLVSENARVRGFRLEGYGVFFDVEVPTLTQTAFLSAVRTLDQNDLGLESALREVRKYIDATGDMNVQQALKRIELQVAPLPLAVAQSAPALAGARTATGAPAATSAGEQTTVDPILNDLNEAYRTEVRNQIIDTMLSLANFTIGPDEWLTVGARRHDDRPLFAPADSDAGTMVIRVRGDDLTSLRSGSLSREEALKRVEVRVF